jgi:ribosomal protein L37E
VSAPCSVCGERPSTARKMCNRCYQKAYAAGAIVVRGKGQQGSPRDRYDVILHRCVTCGCPSEAGLCDPCRDGPPPRKWQPSEDYG